MTTMTTTGTPTTWALDLPNVYGETRAAAITRAERAVAEMDAEIGVCGFDCLDHVADARACLSAIKDGDVSEFGLDGKDVETWTVRADTAESSAGYATGEHETFCLRD